ncbi:hypothetical protein F5148DRAFT_780403 [Russula earlei]|uniref:Uncharacterized protein n=1 Tax=Russula earlei TaxID=71964 RepID=A0ACC0UCE5_9AGAM|nr:hypothetical protein F5148DRAFT_780403 [Russula earlei]
MNLTSERTSSRGNFPATPLRKQSGPVGVVQVSENGIQILAPWSPPPCSMMPTVLPALLSLFGLFLGQFLLELRRVARHVGPVSTPGRIFARLLRPIPYINMGTSWTLGRKYQVFEAAGQDAFAFITALPRPRCIVFLADPAAIKVCLHDLEWS